MPVAADKMETTDLVHALKAAHTDVKELEADIKGKDFASLINDAVALVA